MKNTKILLILVISIFIEVIVFNITSYYTLFGKYEVKTYENPKFLYYENDKAYLEIENINLKVATFKIELKDVRNITEYNILYSDETTSQYWELKPKVYIQSNEKSKYMPLYLSGETKSLIVCIDKNIYDSNGLDKIVLNEKIPFEFNVIRFLIVFGIMIFTYFVKNAEIFNTIYSEKNFKQEIILIGVMAIFLLILVYINTYSDSEISSSRNSYFSITTNEGIYNKDFVDSLANGKLYLLQDPSEEFLKLENPYDALNRNDVERDIDYKWDTAFYNGHQYIYFGVLPALIIFLPFYLLTNKYLKISIVVFAFSILIFTLLKEILLKLLTRYFKEIPFKNVMYSLITLYSGSLILYANGMARVYELVIIVGVYFVLQGIYFILKALEKESNRHINIFWGSLFLALSVACRPTDLLASIIILPFIISLLIKYIKNFKENKINLIKLVSAVGIPYITVGIALMIYNYVRFDNVFDFGNKYQLTINNMMTLGSRIFTIPVGIICNLFTIPKFITEFPFITHSNDLISFNGYYYIENMVGGLFIIAPICFCSFFVFKANKKIENKELKIIINSLLGIGILIAILSIVMAGSNQRYLIDYAWMIILSTILIFISMYSVLKSEEAKKIVQFIFCIATIYTFIISILVGIISEKDYIKNNSPEQYYKLKYNVCFWE